MGSGMGRKNHMQRMALATFRQVRVAAAGCHSATPSQPPVLPNTFRQLPPKHSMDKHIAYTPSLCTSFELPDELILEIFDYLTPIRGFLPSTDPEAERSTENSERIKSLHSLTLTCQRLQALVTPFLYRSFIHRAEDWYAIPLFLRTALEKPTLLRHVQYIETKFRDTKTPEPNDAFPVAQWSQIELALDPSRWNMPWPPLAFAVCGRGGPGRTSSKCRKSVSYIIDKAEKLVDLAMDYADIYILGLYDSPMTHQALRRIWLRGPIDHYGDSDVFIASKDFRDTNPVMQYLQGEERKWHHPQRFVSIDEIVLDNCNMKPEEISLFLAQFTSLTNFTCRWTSHRSFSEEDLEWGPGPSRIDLGLLHRDLSYFKGSLERLVLDTLESTWQVSMDEDIPTIGSLHDFTALKHLDVSGLVLWSDDDDTIEHPPLALILPESLETLTVHVEWDDYVEESLIGLSRDCQSLLPHLKSIDCSWRPAPGEMADVLTAMFKDANVELKLDHLEDAPPGSR